MSEDDPLPKDHIRLFVLLPGENSSPLSGYIVPVDLSEPYTGQEYKALSYTWEDVTDTEKQLRPIR
ncbi:uncharacterized protein Z518_09112 [Rhinocladiella mackenziei CBS 650.93]|uniref:Heterokaryon incompatibility domain-containing protein n=1 Tax=Rhinocladiella mackenziei CBS 650.93 TaxID=1442369 RepID=A0A0D2FH85_9EURO|nr:uncharacterized protein Z518_09112 [Rhinocladiella mackenziei CBS 650.93]KIX01387.1 hypothetical protein Z518_09112 [Rhinocladiella mackenziei CBS 650.93]